MQQRIHFSVAKQPFLFSCRNFKLRQCMEHIPYPHIGNFAALHFLYVKEIARTGKEVCR